MVVFSMNSKRIRRPSVRLWEVGDLSAAFTCGISKLNNGNTRRKKWKSEFSDKAEESKCLHIPKLKQFESTNLDPSKSAGIFGNGEHNIENWDPNSSNLVPEFSFLDNKKEKKSELDFVVVTRRSRVMNRRKRDPNSLHSFFCPWKSEVGCSISENEIMHGSDQLVACSSGTGLNIYRGNGSMDSWENESSGIIKEARDDETDEQNFSLELLQRPTDSGTETTWSNENTRFPQYNNGYNDEVSKSNDGDVGSVREWLEELGFGKFADLFEIHEVDEETLPLLTFEDLKDMGIDAIGARRKLFTAIQQLGQRG
ncbi:OLC1v1013965C1 [Oldenlandia corymbosa var. corymbosa]|uniref:OLC1v1013965C1 n=1 Tax=Oldenlandia corymbosa var. corymbosa TaxID=529605 RepID=A0AAV1DZM2_OLDCO|nr:OLC1v1013965C1 [Oldenlandia corymbosa var. corymbosa]